MRRTGFPFLDHSGPVIAFAHRGGAGHPDLVGLENTRAAFAHAVALGYTYLETDVHVTRDGLLVAFHDALLERVTDGIGSLESLDAVDLARVRASGAGPRAPAPGIPSTPSPGPGGGGVAWSRSRPSPSWWRRSPPPVS